MEGPTSDTIQILYRGREGRCRKNINSKEELNQEGILRVTMSVNRREIKYQRIQNKWKLVELYQSEHDCHWINLLTWLIQLIISLFFTDKIDYWTIALWLSCMIPANLRARNVLNLCFTFEKKTRSDYIQESREHWICGGNLAKPLPPWTLHSCEPQGYL